MAFTNSSFIPFSFVIDNPDRNWDWNALSSHPELTFDIIKQLKNESWNWSKISAHPCVTIKTLIENPRNEHTWWDYLYLSANPNMTWNIIKDNINSQNGWCLAGLYMNPNITWEFIQNLPPEAQLLNRISDEDDNTYIGVYFARNRVNMSWDIVRKNPEIPWDYVHLFSRLPLDIDTINEFGSKLYEAWPNHEFNEMSYNPNLTFEIISVFPSLRWDFKHLSSHIIRNTKYTYVLK